MIDKTDPETLDTEERSRFARHDIQAVLWNSVLDVYDSHLRKITIGQGEQEQHPRATCFAITVESEIMVVLALTTSLADMRERLGSMVVALGPDEAPVTTDESATTWASAG